MPTCSRSLSILSLLGGFLIAQGTPLAVGFAASGPSTPAAQTAGSQAPAGDTVLLSKSALGKMAPVLNRVSLGLYLNPLQ